MNSLYLTNKTLEVQSSRGRQVYQVSNIAKVARYQYQKKSSIRASVFFTWLVVGILIMLLSDAFYADLQAVGEESLYFVAFLGFSLAVGSSVVLVVAFFEYISNPVKHIFVVESGSALSAIFSSKSRGEIDDLIDQVVMIMANPNQYIEYNKVIYENMVIGNQVNQGDIHGMNVISQKS